MEYSDIFNVCLLLYIHKYTYNIYTYNIIYTIVYTINYTVYTRDVHGSGWFRVGFGFYEI